MQINKEIIFFLKEQFYQKNENQLWQAFSSNNYQYKSRYEEVDVYIDSPYFNLIPDELFQGINEKQKNDFLVSDHKNYNFFSQSIPNLSGQLYWCAKKEVINLIKNKIPNCNINQLIKPLLINNKSSEIKYYLSTNFIYITSFKDGILNLANRFYIKSEDDALYFILNVIKESKLINMDFEFSTYGLNNDKLISKLKSIFPNNNYFSHEEKDLNSIFK